jgi:hypothetical protein
MYGFTFVTKLIGLRRHWTASPLDPIKALSHRPPTKKEVTTPTAMRLPFSLRTNTPPPLSPTHTADDDPVRTAQSLDPGLERPIAASAVEQSQSERVVRFPILIASATGVSEAAVASAKTEDLPNPRAKRRPACPNAAAAEAAETNVAGTPSDDATGNTAIATSSAKRRGLLTVVQLS